MMLANISISQVLYTGVSLYNYILKIWMIPDCRIRCPIFQRTVPHVCLHWQSAVHWLLSNSSLGFRDVRRHHLAGLSRFSKHDPQFHAPRNKLDSDCDDFQQWISIRTDMPCVHIYPFTSFSQPVQLPNTPNQIRFKRQLIRSIWLLLVV